MMARKPGAAALRAVAPTPPTDTAVGDDTLREAARQEIVHEVDWSICMARAQDGDREAYRRLLDSVTPYLRSLALRRLQSRGDAEDVVQEILLTVHSIRHTYDPARPFGPWLISIAQRRIVDALRRQGRRQSREQPLEAEHEALSAPDSNLEAVAADARLLRRALDRLPEGQRRALHMLKLEEMTLKEASKASGMSIVALKVATHRGLKRLRRLLKDEDT